MAWPEPLTATTAPISPLDPKTRRVILRDGNNRIRAVTTYIIDVNSALGPVLYRDKTGTARQIIRAFGLMIRECVRGARAEGVQHYFASVQPHMARVARLASGGALTDGREGVLMGRLDELKVALDQRIATDGRLPTATAQDEADAATDMEIG